MRVERSYLPHLFVSIRLRNKPRTSSAARRSSSAAKRPMKLATPKVATTIAERISHPKGSVVPSVSRFMSKCVSGAKSGSTSERLATMKKRKVDLLLRWCLGLFLILLRLIHLLRKGNLLA